MKKVATVILNRNLPKVTDRLVDHLKLYDDELTDIYVLEAGSDMDKLSSYTTWHANWKEAQENGLRYSRGMNYALKQLWDESKFKEYDAFLLLTNDTELEEKETVRPLLKVMKEHPYVGILSPCSHNWGERFLLKEKETKYFWFIHNNAYMLRREFIESIYNIDDDFKYFLFDGDNFRGYCSEHEIIAKAYANDWAAAITNEVFASENESYLLNKADLIKTTSYEENLEAYVREGLQWLRKKYGFTSHWSMQLYSKTFYDLFFDLHPNLNAYRL